MKKSCRLLLTTVSALFCSFNTYAQVNTLNFNEEVRYDLIRGEEGIVQNRVQDRVRIGFTFDANGYFQLVGLLESGPGYGNDWTNIYDFKADENKFNPNLFFRRLYLKKMFGQKTEMRLGALEGIESTGAGGLASSGWVDGIQLMHNRGGFNYNIRVGSLSDVANPNVFSREHQLNFIEVEMSKKFLKKIMVKAGYEHFQDHFVRLGVDFDSKILAREVITFVGHVLYDVNNQGLNFDFGVKGDVLKAFNESFANYIKLDLLLSRTDTKLHFRNSLYSAYYQDATTVNIGFSGQFDKKGHYRWFVRDSLGLKESRLDVGLGLSF
jgi:hypothetical protein